MNGRIELRHDGFEFRWNDPASVPAVVRWDEVTRIRTYKRDLFAVDTVCLEFERTSGGPVEIREEDEGFRQLGEGLRERFPDIPADWYERVVQPPFARNEAVLFQSPGPWRVTRGALVSPGGRFELELDVREVFNSHWASTPTIVERAGRSRVVSLTSPWSCEEVEWRGGSATLTLRKYPGNHTPADITATIDCPGKTGAVGGGSPLPLEALETALESALTFHWAPEAPPGPPNPLRALFKRLLGG